MQFQTRAARPQTPVTDRPLACAPLTSFRLGGPFGWIMIGAKDEHGAMQEARRSTPHPRREDLQRWNGQQYLPC